MGRSICAGRLLGLTTLMSGALATAPVEAAYVFTRIADSSGPISVFGVPALNVGGTVAFRTSLDAGGQAIYTGNGGALTSVADTLSGPYGGFGDPVINGGGSVAFRAGTSNGQGIFRFDGGPTTTIAATVPAGGQFVILDSSSLSINAGGRVSFTGEMFGGPLGVFASGGGPTTTIAAAGGAFQSFGGFTSINDAGTVAFRAVLPGPNAAGVFAGDGGPVTTIADSNGPFTGQFGTPAINAAGTVAFAAGRDAGGVGIFTGAGGPVTTVLDSSGLYQSFFTNTSSGDLGIDAQGRIVFAALGGGGQGLFSGPDPVLDKVIVLGDTLDGSAVNFLAFYQNGVNAGSQVAFFVGLDDGRTGIFRADLAAVPEPTSLVLSLIGIAAGMWSFRRGARRPGKPATGRG
jgi:hypothetical protein